MDRYWEANLWQPTIVNDGGSLQQFVPLHLKEVERCRENLRECTKVLALFPYTPSHWRNRSAVLLELGYPELAAADAYKALILTTSVFDGKYLGSRVWLEMGMAIWYRDAVKGNPWDVNFSATKFGIQMLDFLKYERKQAYTQLIFSLCYLQALPDIKAITTEALKRYPDDITFLYFQHAATSAYESNRTFIYQQALPDGIKWVHAEMGTVWNKPYPWASGFHTRTKRSIKAANIALKKCSKVLRIQPSNMTMSDSGGVCYGMFASQDIHRGDTIIERSPVLSISGLQLKTHLNLIDSLLGEPKTRSKTSPGNCFNCYGLLNKYGPKYGFACCSHLYFCSKDCKNLAQQYYHDALCGTNIIPIYSFSKNKKCYVCGPEIAGMIWLRLLATCKQGGGHPLQHPLVTNLSIHEAAAQDPWSLNVRVIRPLKTLEILGIDVFANQWYDTWVLETLWQIFRVNSAGAYNTENEYGCWVDSFYAMFNHSCEDPRMMGTHIQDFDRAGSKFQHGAAREIKKGEEVCVSYIEVLSRSKMERRKALAGWLSGDCKCKRCLAE
ncbi:uncharacterized protein EAE98_002529 [Botrytis deweyae]|uniref:SET domain-containing protein n=1 Tax=Botrytis deweyae TaxID=2478750 RepID=A0ABQ7IXG0_9HELO|nr:uncharacterized protein EAE98_002529 [Botrytis deweyae]KAF7936310.1 hypothetical protein EAE98_002529 [Botrytis deweyae]